MRGCGELDLVRSTEYLVSCGPFVLLSTVLMYGVLVSDLSDLPRGWHKWSQFLFQITV